MNPQEDDSLENTADFSYPSHSDNSDLGKKNENQPGRTKAPFTILLENFHTDRRRHPKKEYFNAFSIRGIQRAFRNVSQGKIPKATCIAINFTNEKEANIWNKFRHLYSRDQDLLKKISKTRYEVPIDSKSIRVPSEQTPNFRSFNNEFCKSFFQSDITKDAFLLLVELLFCSYDPKTLYSKFKFKCCFSNSHTPECFAKWRLLENYLHEKYFADMDIEYRKPLSPMIYDDLTTFEPSEMIDNIESYMICD